MYAAQTTYHRASSVAEAVQILSDNEGAKILAGGHSLIPLMKLRLSAPETLVDIGRIDDLKGISDKDDQVCIGALATHAEIASSDAVQQHAPLLAEAAGTVGDPAVRNRGTIGGKRVPRRPGVGPADGADRPGGHVLRDRTGRKPVYRRRGLRSGPPGELSRGQRGTDARLRTLAGVRLGLRLREAIASRVAVRRSRRRRGRVRRRGEVLVGERRDRRRGGHTYEGVVRRVGAGGIGPERRRPGTPRRPRSATTSATTSWGTYSRRPSTARQWPPSTFAGRCAARGSVRAKKTLKSSTRFTICPSRVRASGLPYSRGQVCK